MTATVLLNNVDHQDLRIVTRHSAEFGDNVNQVLIFPTEFGEIQREYPIFFRKDERGGYHAVALLGLDKDENLFLGGDGWQARYVPAVQERGPFLIGFQEEQVGGELRREPMIHVDLDHPRVRRGDGEGQPVFRTHGGNTPYLEHVSHLLRTIHEGAATAPAMFEAFEQAGLIEPVSVEIQLNDAEQYTLPDLHTVSEERLAGLDGKALERLHRSGFLRAAFMVSASLGNVGRLIDLKNRKNAASRPPS